MLCVRFSPFVGDLLPGGHIAWLSVRFSALFLGVRFIIVV